MNQGLSSVLAAAREAGQPILLVLAGSNGAGKSTYHSEALATLGLPFVNADDIARARSGSYAQGADADAGYVAMHAAAAERQRLIEQRESFVMETVLSDPQGAKLDFFRSACAAGYCFILIYIKLRNADLSIARVMQRVEAGGHDVPDEKLLARFSRTKANAAEALRIAHYALVLDNSSLENPYRCVETWRSGQRIEGDGPT